MARTSYTRRYPIPTRRHPPRWEIPALAPRPPWYKAFGAFISLIFVGLILVMCFVLPEILPYEPTQMDLSARLQAPSTDHWFGTDEFGRDMFCRVLYGGRISLPIGIIAVLAATLPGLWLGLLAGYHGGWIDTIVGRLTDILLAFPSILLALLIVAWLGPGVYNTMLAIGLTGIPNYIRLTRSRAIQLRKTWFVRAAQVVGCTDTRILIRHILPNIMPTILALATLDLAWAILNASILSFLGLGVKPPTPEWGAMINQGRGFLRQAPWISLAPGMMLASTVLMINLLGDGLRNALDPRTRQ